MCLENLSSTTKTPSSSTWSQCHQRAACSTIVPWAYETDGQTYGIGQSRFLLPYDGTETLLRVCQTEYPISFNNQ